MNKENPIKIFISYSHKDEHYKDKLLTFLAPLKSKGLLNYWEASQLLIGANFTQEILEKLNAAHLFVLLLSSDAVASEYINNIELSLALAKYERGEMLIIPVIIRPCNWEILNLNHLHVAPPGGKAITLWENEDLAFKEISTQLERLLENLSKTNSSDTSQNVEQNSPAQSSKSVQSQTLNIGSVDNSILNNSTNATINQTFNIKKNNNKKFPK